MQSVQLNLYSYNAAGAVHCTDNNNLICIVPVSAKKTSVALIFSEPLWAAGGPGNFCARVPPVSTRLTKPVHVSTRKQAHPND